MRTLNVALVGLLLAACGDAAAPASRTTASSTSLPTASPSPVTTAAAASPSPLMAPTATASPIPMPTFTQISAPSTDVVWALVAGSRLFVSTDRGDAWQERTTPVAEGQVAPNLDVSFVSATEGWAMSAGSPGTQCTFQSQSVGLWHTADGARTWTKLAPTGIPDAQCKEALSFVSPGTGFISAWDQNDAPTILQTRDGGKTWRGATLPDPPGFTTRAGGLTLRAGRVHAVGTEVVVEATGNVGGTLRRYVFVWEDNAPTWQYGASVPDAQAAFAFANSPGGGDRRWLLIAPGRTSQESLDGGRTWHPFATDYSQAAPIAPVVTFADAKVGYATVRGSIQRTTDGGARWTAIKTPGTLSP